MYHGVIWWIHAVLGLSFGKIVTAHISYTQWIKT